MNILEAAQKYTGGVSDIATDRLTDILEAAQKYTGGAYDPETGSINMKKMKEHARGERGTTNILLMGATGSGKSSLINAIFGSNVVKAGTGQPVTQNLEKVKIKEKGLILWDTKGIEAGNYEETMRKLTEEVDAPFKTAKEKDELPHIALLCIKESSSRIENREHELLEITKKHDIPTIVVFTDMRGDKGEEFCKKAEEIFSNEEHVKGFARVNSCAYKINGVEISVAGIKELVDKIEQHIKDAHEKAAKHFAAIQRANIEKKLAAMTDEATTIIHLAAVAAGAAGATPIPMSDAPIIAAIQSGMIYKINTAFELSTEETGMTSLITGILGVTAVAQVGRTVVTNALKFIPGAGTLIGGAISATTATAITEAIGHAWIAVLTNCLNEETGEVELPEVFESILPVFKEHFTQLYKK